MRPRRRQLKLESVVHLDTVQKLHTEGWLPLVVWEHEPPDAAAAAFRRCTSSGRRVVNGGDADALTASGER